MGFDDEAVVSCTYLTIMSYSCFQTRSTQQDASQDLRSALDEKARKAGPSTQARGRRKMKRGQAKTLSDLPKLNSKSNIVGPFSVGDL